MLLRDVNLHIHCGELTALIGANGAGKTTLLRALLGQVEYKGDRAPSDDGRTPCRRRCARAMFLSSWSLTAPLRSRSWTLWRRRCPLVPVFLGVGKKTKEKVIAPRSPERIAKSCEKRPLGALSGGELQRVLLALALTPQPDLLILDEPVSGVDQNGLESFYQTVDELKRTNHMAILLVSHDLDVVRRYADRVVLMQGTVVRQGDPETGL